RFRHLLIRDAAYDSVPKLQRAGLHERLANRLEEDGAEGDEIIGYHLEQAYRHRRDLDARSASLPPLARRAAARLAAAGRGAHVRGDMPAAVNLLTRAAS